jgi:hypothetical protein
VCWPCFWQLGGEQKLLTRCQHESVGPPCKSFLFDHDEIYGSLVACYAHHVARALSFVRETYRGLHLDDRVAILGPSASFVAALREPLAAALETAHPHHTVALVSAADASAAIGNALEHGAPTDGIERIVLDAIEQFDGLERLIIVAVGLDTPITTDATEAPVSEASSGAMADEEPTRSAADQQTRSMLYRAVTRAHMQVIVVNELLSGG